MAHAISSEIIVQSGVIAGTGIRVYTAWEPSGLMGAHSTITTIGGKWYGKIGSNPDRAIYDHLPVGQERFDAVEAAYQAQYERAYQAIREANPTLAGDERDGEIIVREGK